jgi:hypothetical protein
MEVPEVTTGYRRFADSERKSGVVFLDPNTSYKSHGRRLGVVTSLVIGIVPFLPLVGEYSDHAVDFALHLSVSIIIGVLEIPFLCTMLQFCKKIQGYLSAFEVPSAAAVIVDSHLQFAVVTCTQVYYRRGILYWILCLVMISVQLFVSQTGFGLNFFIAWTMIGLVFVCGLLYIVSYFNGETQSGTLFSLDFTRCDLKFRESTHSFYRR